MAIRPFPLRRPLRTVISWQPIPSYPPAGIITFPSKEQARIESFTEQAEDEISATNIAVRASYAAARAMTATSGWDIAFMVDATSLTRMTNTQLVIVMVNAQGLQPTPPPVHNPGESHFCH